MRSYGQKLFIGVLGIYCSYITLGYLAEGLFNTKFTIPSSKDNSKEDFEKFKFPSLITWVGCLFCSIYGLLYAHFRDHKPNFIPHKERLRLGLLFTLNYLPTNYSLLFISYPLQVVVKNSRYILVVIVGIFFSRVEKSKSLKLPRSKLFIGILITIGAGLFMHYQTGKEVKNFDLDPSKQWVGYLLLLVAIICDAFFSDTQAYCKANFKPTPNQLFLAANLYSFVLIFIFSLIIGELRPSLLFCIRHPTALIKILGIGCLQVTGQVAVYYVISNFKQHIYPLMSTTRKILTILVSIIIFQHNINADQWFALIIVFLSMAYELYDEVSSQEHHRVARQRKLRKSNQNSEAGSKITESHASSHGSKVQFDQPVRKQPSSLKESLNIANKSMRSSRTNKTTRVKHLVNNILSKQNRDDSLSKFRYNWRLGEVVENREISLTPIETHVD